MDKRPGRPQNRLDVKETREIFSTAARTSILLVVQLVASRSTDWAVEAQVILK
jgi:hypothetical protein